LGFLPLRSGLSKRGRSTRESGQILDARGLAGEEHGNRRQMELKAGERERIKDGREEIIEKQAQEPRQTDLKAEERAKIKDGRERIY